jgi:acetyl-CoA synthetase
MPGSSPHSDPAQRTALARLFEPASIAVVGGEVAAEVIRQCRRIGYAGTIWPVNPGRSHIEGLPAYARIEDLPGAPDAAFVAVPREAAIEVVAALALRGAGGAVCYASGYAELDAAGAALQQRLVASAGAMALLGPNCYGLINYLDGCALWPDHLGGTRVERGVAIITQSGNIALNLTMQRHHLPLAYMISLGNQAVTRVHECIEALLDDPRVTAIGLHLEGLGDVPAFAAAACAALRRGRPLVVLKSGASEMGAQLAASHTRSLAGSDVLYRALFERYGVARVDDLAELLETLKLLHVTGPLPGTRVGSLSCSGGDAALVADLGQARGLQFPRLPEAAARGLAGVLGPHVPIHNPLDYHTYIWGDRPALQACFGAMMAARHDLTLLVLDFPLAGPGPLPGWDEVVEAYLGAHRVHGGAAVLVSSMAELLPEAAAQRLLAAGIAPLQGLREATVAIAAAAGVGRRRAAGAAALPLPAPRALRPGPVVQLDEVAAKAWLQRHGLRIPAGAVVVDREQAVLAADAIGYPVVLKGVDAALAHKTEAGAVRLGLGGAPALRRAFEQLEGRFARQLVERMIDDGLAEWIVGVTRDEQFGLSMTIGAGGILVELLADTVTLLLPATREELAAAMRRLRCFALIDGYRGRPRADAGPLLDALAAIAAFAQAHAERLVELDVNPLLVAPGAVTALDALIRWVEEGPAAPAP